MGEKGRVAMPPLGSFRTCLATHVYPFFKNNIMSYNISSSPIDQYKKFIPLLDS